MKFIGTGRVFLPQSKKMVGERFEETTIEVSGKDAEAMTNAANYTKVAEKVTRSKKDASGQDN